MEPLSCAASYQKPSTPASPTCPQEKGDPSEAGEVAFLRSPRAVATRQNWMCDCARSRLSSGLPAPLSYFTYSSSSRIPTRAFSHLSQ